MATPVAASSQTHDLQSFLADYERDYPDEVVHVEQPLDAAWELTALIMKLEKAKRFPVVVCHNVVVDGRRSEIPLVLFLTASRLRLARALGADVRNAGLVSYQRVQQRQKPVVVSREEALVKQVVETGAQVDVRRFPAPRQHRMDPGRYITEGFLVTYNRTSRLENAAMHRGWLADPDEIRIWLNPASHNAANLRQYEAAGEDMPAAFWIGHHPLVILGAETHVEPDESHFESAGGTLGAPLRLVPSETLGEDFLVPADAEVVIEGYVPRAQRKPEGPFGEYTRHYGPQQWAPLMKVTAVTHRRNPYWSDVMSGHTYWIGSLTDEGEIYHAVRRVVPTVRAVHVPMSGCGRAHVYIQIRKTMEGQGKTAAVAALLKRPIRHAFVVDEDVDVFDEQDVLLALATRFQAGRGLVVLDGMLSSGLDPASPDGRTTSKLGFDCTKPLGEPFPERLGIPDEVLQRIDPVAILGREKFERIPVELWG